MPGLFGVTPGGGLIPVTPEAKLHREKAQYQRTPQLSSKFFTRREVEENPELQRSIRPFEVPALREQLQRRTKERLYQQADQAIDTLQIPDGYKPIAKIGLRGMGDKVTNQFLYDLQRDKWGTTKKVLDHLKDLNLESFKQKGAAGLQTQKHTGSMELERLKQGGKVKLLGKKEKKPDRKNLADQLRQWVNAGRQLEQGAISSELVAGLGSINPKFIDAYGQAMQSQDTSDLSKIVEEQIDYLQQALDEFDIKTQFPDAEQDEYGWYIVKNGKKFYIKRVEQ